MTPGSADSPTSSIELPPIRAPFARVEAGEDWVEIAQLLGYAGKSRDAQRAERDDAFGPDNWCQRWQYRDGSISHAAALALYEEAYYQFLRSSPDTLSWLSDNARDVYDNGRSNLDSGCDYAVQELAATHLQDIALRRVLARLGRRFRGSQLLEVRGPRSAGFALNPGQVLFHDPEAIVTAPAWRTARAWWRADSTEAFYQHNKLLAIAPSALFLRPIVLDREGLWCVLRGLPRFAVSLASGTGRRHLAMPDAAVRARWSVPASRRECVRITGAPWLAYEALRCQATPEIPSGPQIAWDDLCP